MVSTIVSAGRIRQEVVARESEEMAGSFRTFLEAAWPICEPGAVFMGGYHLDAVAAHLQACAEGDISKLLINIPPRTGKSTLVSVLYPAWLWTRDATERMLFASYALDLSRRDSMRNRRIIKTKWYTDRWPHVVLSEDLDTKTTFENTETGIRQTTSCGGVTTGLGGTHLVLDDPNAAQQAESHQVRETTLNWFRESWSTRLNPGRGVQIVIMQRLHQGDVSGYCLEEGGWEHLCLPMEYEGSKKATSIGWTDPRTEPGEVLWKERFGSKRGAQELKELKRTLGSVGVAGQLQQRPVPRGGSTFKASWLRYWYDPDLGIPDPVMYVKPDNTMVESQQKVMPRHDPNTAVSSWDLAFKGGERNDFVAGQTWVSGIKEDRANRYLIAQEHGHFDFVETIQAIRRLNGTHPPAVTLIEEKANGAAVITSIKTEMPAVVAVNPEGGKESRASGVAPMFEAGNVWLPHPKQFPWVQKFIDELCAFPRGNNDDMVDACTQALIRMKSRHTEELDMAPSINAGARSSPWRV